MNIVITGSRKGIGRFLCEYYAGKGHTVVGCSREMSDCGAKGYTHFCADVTEEKSVGEFVSFVRKTMKEVDVLINNAGIASMNHFLTTPPETAKKLMAINYIGTFNCSRAFLGLLKKSAHPRIVNFSTVAVPLNLEGELAYVVSKSAVESFTRVLAKEIAVFDVTVNAVGPTPIDTDLISKVPKEKIDKLVSMQAIKRLGIMDDVANVIDFFIRPESDFITGQVIYLGGVS